MKATRNFFWAAGIGFLCFASSAVASDTLGLQSVSTSFYGENTSPYEGTVDGVATALICDQLALQFNIPDSWQATDVTLGSLSLDNMNYNVVFNSTTDPALSTAALQVTAYVEAAYMAVNLLSLPSGSQVQADEAWAIWNIFDPGALTQAINNGMSTGPGSDDALAQADFNAAQSFVTTNGLANAQLALGYVNIWVPTSYTNGDQTEQEFMTVDEPPSPVLLGLYMLSGLALFGAFRKYASAR